MLLGHTAHDHQLTGAEESVLTWDQQDNTEGALAAELPSKDLPLNIPLLSPLTSSPPAAPPPTGYQH